MPAPEVLSMLNKVAYAPPRSTASYASQKQADAKAFTHVNAVPLSRKSSFADAVTLQGDEDPGAYRWTH